MTYNYNQISQITSFLPGQNFSVINLTEDYLTGISTRAIKCIDYTDTLSEVEIFNYPSLNNLKLQYQKTGKYTADEINSIINSYARLPKYKNRA
jgi:hypothetical protein